MTFQRHTSRDLPKAMSDMADSIKDIARGLGLDFWEIVFELIDSEELNEVAAYGGFPTRYPHWKFGMAYEELIKGYAYGLSKIYELVINNDPCYAYLMRQNSMVDQKLVMAHVCGHADFFKNNMWFAHTNRKMMDQMANHGTRIRSLAEKYGQDKVEDFIDCCLCLDNLIDIYSPYIKRRPSRRSEVDPDARKEEELARRKLPSSDYMDRYINPPEYLEQQRQLIDQSIQQQTSFPAEPERDVLLFLLEHAPLKPWQRTILGIIREEAYYFAPQGMTKIMNEGWACLAADSLVPTEAGLIPMREVVEGQARTVFDGQKPQKIYDQHIIENHATVKITTRRGFRLEGSINHRLLKSDGETWVRLDELQLGTQLLVSGGAKLWPEHEVALSQAKSRRKALQYVGAPANRFSSPATQPSKAPRTLNVHLAHRLGQIIGGDSVIDSEAVTLKSLLSERGTIPDAVLRSPKRVVSAFLRAYFDSQGHPGQHGITVHTANDQMSERLQLILLNYGVLSKRQCLNTEGWQVQFEGRSVQVFAREIGFGLSQKQSRVKEYLSQAQPLAKEDWLDEVQSIEFGEADVYDISVTESHRYAACGFINHNSYWHSRMMTEKLLTDSEVICYAETHAGTVGGNPGQLNPYKVGIELFRNIEERWNKGQFGKEWDECEDFQARKNWDKKLGKGRDKIFEVRKIYNDVTFIDEYLTEDFCHEHKLFVYDYNRQTGEYVISSRDFGEVKQRLLRQLVNFGQPIIHVVNANFRNRGELYLKHQHEGVDLHTQQAKDTLKNLQKIWSRPVHLETVIENRKKVLSFDGQRLTDNQKPL